jgi:superfamily II DNA or RNA helicase
MITVHARESLLIKRKTIPIALQEDLTKKYSYRFYDERVCKNCEFLEDRHCETCDNCDAFKGGADLATPVKIGKTEYLKAPIGDRSGVLRMISQAGIDYKIKSHAPRSPMKRPFKFTGTLKDHQPTGVNAIIEKRRGVLRSPPRSGKTVMATAAICKIAQKTMILASQVEWLDGFAETFIGSESQPALTNCRKTQIGRARTLADFERLDVCLVTPQTFRSPRGKRILRKIRDMFPVLVVDEVHTAAAAEYAKVIASLNTRYKIGLSGTPNRKDGRYVIMRNLIGPIIADIKVESVVPHGRLVRTAYSEPSKKGNYQVPWSVAVNRLEYDPKRLKLIADWALKDASNGHMILIPLARIKSMEALTMAINKMAGTRIAEVLNGKVPKVKRKQLILDARAYRVKVLVGTTKLLTTGTNIPRASALYDVTLSSNDENCEQRSRRVCTPFDGKPTPIIRFFLDDVGVRRNCLRNEYYNVLRPIIKLKLTAQDEQAMKQYLQQKSASSMRRISLD